MNEKVKVNNFIDITDTVDHKLALRKARLFFFFFFMKDGPCNFSLCINK